MRKRKAKLNDMPKDQMDKCNVIIHSAAMAAGGVGTGMAQIPLADNAIITPIQIAMIVSLGKVFDRNIGESAARAIISSAASSIVGRSISQIFLGWIPGLGNAINTATAAGITEAIGWLAVNEFYNSETNDGTQDYTKEQSEEYYTDNASKTQGDADKDDKSECCNTKEQLKKRANEFFNDIKNPAYHKVEYEKLLEDVNNYPDDEEMNALYKRLCKYGADYELGKAIVFK